MLKSIRKVTIYAVVIAIGLFISVNEPETIAILRGGFDTENDVYASNESVSEISYDMSYYNSSNDNELLSVIEPNNSFSTNKEATNHTTENNGNNNETAINSATDNHINTNTTAGNNAGYQQNSGPNMGDGFQDFASNNTATQSAAKVNNTNTNASPQPNTANNESREITAVGGVVLSAAPPPPGGGNDPNADIPLDDFYGLLLILTAAILFVFKKRLYKFFAS